jgi:transcriptional regulator with XRE-family HTH domain
MIGGISLTIFEELKNREYRDAYVRASIDIGVPVQIRTLRKQREWTQEKLASKANMKQESISRIEDQTRGSVNLKTLIKLASAFDLALVVRFVSFGDLVKWKRNLSKEKLEAISFEDEPYLRKGDNGSIALKASLKEDNLIHAGKLFQDIGTKKKEEKEMFPNYSKYTGVRNEATLG